MKKHLILFSVLMAGSLLIFQACNDDDDFDVNGDSSPQQPFSTNYDRDSIYVSGGTQVDVNFTVDPRGTLDRIRITQIIEPTDEDSVIFDETFDSRSSYSDLVTVNFPVLPDDGDYVRLHMEMWTPGGDVLDNDFYIFQATQYVNYWENFVADQDEYRIFSRGFVHHALDEGIDFDGNFAFIFDQGSELGPRGRTYDPGDPDDRIDLQDTNEVHGNNLVVFSEEETAYLEIDPARIDTNNVRNVELQHIYQQGSPAQEISDLQVNTTFIMRLDEPEHPSIYKLIVLSGRDELNDCFDYEACEYWEFEYFTK